MTENQERKLAIMAGLGFEPTTSRNRVACKTCGEHLLWFHFARKHRENCPMPYFTEPREIMGVPVDRVFFATLEALQTEAEGLAQLSRPRNTQDTTDEWLNHFYELTALCLQTVIALGDQSDLTTNTVPLGLFDRARLAHHGE